MAHEGGGTLHFSMPGTQLRKFKTAVQSLGKIGSELLIEGIPERLILRAINSSKSAFMAVTFQAAFFSGYAVSGAPVAQAGVLLKHALAALRTQRVALAAFELASEARLSVTLECDNGLVKRYTIGAVEADILHATVDLDACPTSAVADASELNRLLGSFQASLDEVTIMAIPAAPGGAASDAPARSRPAARSDQAGGPFSSAAAGTTTAGVPSVRTGGGPGGGAGGGAQVRLQSFVDPAKGAAQAGALLHTRLDLDAGAAVFSGYSHLSDAASDATFNVKDLRALLGLCEAMGADVKLRFDGPGAPLHAEPHPRGGGGTFGGGEPDCQYTAELVLATLVESVLPADLMGTPVAASGGGVAAAGRVMAAAPPPAQQLHQRHYSGSGVAGAPAGGWAQQTPAAQRAGPAAAAAPTPSGVPGDTPWGRGGGGGATTAARGGGGAGASAEAAAGAPPDTGGRVEAAIRHRGRLQEESAAAAARAQSERQQQQQQQPSATTATGGDGQRRASRLERLRERMEAEERAAADAGVPGRYSKYSGAPLGIGGAGGGAAGTSGGGGGAVSGGASVGGGGGAAAAAGSTRPPATATGRHEARPMPPSLDDPESLPAPSARAGTAAGAAASGGGGVAGAHGVAVAVEAQRGGAEWGQEGEEGEEGEEEELPETPPDGGDDADYML